MKVAKIIWRIIPHLLGWGALFLIVLLQNDLGEWDFEDYYILGGFFGFLAIATYINLVHVSQIEGNRVKLGDTEVPVSGTYKQELLDTIA